MIGRRIAAVKHLDEYISIDIHSIQEKRGAIGSLCSFVQRHFNNNEEKCYELKLVLNELIQNAINCQSGCTDQMIKTEIRLIPASRGLYITVTDDGPGYNPFKTIQSLQENMPSRNENGRGMLLIREYCQSMDFNPLGNRITVTMLF
jgi:serine/threonine-protein kinase RsbW